MNISFSYAGAPADQIVKLPQTKTDAVLQLLKLRNYRIAAQAPGPIIRKRCEVVLNLTDDQIRTMIKAYCNRSQQLRMQKNVDYIRDRITSLHDLAVVAGERTIHWHITRR